MENNQKAYKRECHKNEVIVGNDNSGKRPKPVETGIRYGAMKWYTI